MLRQSLTIVNDSNSRGTKRVEIADKISRKSPMTAAPTTHIRWLLILCLFVLSAVAYLDRVNLSIASAKLTVEFGISNVRLGFVFSSFLLGYALFQTPAGWLADRFSKRQVTIWTKVMEIGAMTIATVGLALHAQPLTLVALGLVATQAALFGPSAPLQSGRRSSAISRSCRSMATSTRARARPRSARRCPSTQAARTRRECSWVRSSSSMPGKASRAISS